MEYIIVKKGIVIEHYCGEEVPKKAIPCPKGYAGAVGDKVEDFTEDFSAYVKKESNEKSEANSLSAVSEKEQNEKTMALNYLKATDWYVMRYVETGEEIPETIKNQREECRKLLFENIEQNIEKSEDIVL